MSYAIVFSSKTGNTKLLADTLHSCLPRKAAAILALRTLLPWRQTSSTWASGQTKEPLTKVLWTF